MPLYVDLQYIFNIVYRGLASQGWKKSVYRPEARWNDHNSCRYRSEDGLKCAVGHLIPDELYTPVIEGTGPATFAKPARDIFEKLWSENLNEHLTRMQKMHDNAKSPEDMRRKFDMFAKHNQLTIPRDAIGPIRDSRDGPEFIMMPF